MLSTAVIVFREVLEAALIVTLVLAATRGLIGRRRWIGTGITVGLALALVVAQFAEVIGEQMEGVGQEMFNACVLLSAVALLGWHNVWMKKHSQELVAQMKQWSAAVKEGSRPLYVLAVVVGLAVLREGSEVVLFMNGIAASGTQSASMWMGGALGIAGGVALGVVLYFGLARIPLKQLFSVSGILILLLAASLSSQSAAYLVQADVLPALIPVVWDSSAILSQSSLLGEILHTLVGYEARPMGIQLIFYFFTFVLIGGLMWWVNRGLKKPATTSAAPAVISAIVVVTLLQFGVSHSAMAGSFIYSPIVDQGEWEYEVKSERLIDKDNSIDGESVLKPSIGYGVNAFWFTEVYGEYEIKADGEREYEATAWENIFQLTAQGEYFVDLGIAAEYEFAAESYNNDKMELKLLMEKSINRATFTANYGVERYFGSGASNEVEHGASFRAKWRQSQAFEPGVEVFSELGDIDQQRSLGNYSQRVGPVFTGSKRMSNTSKFAYEAGYLFGLNDNSPEGTMKLMLEYEFIY